MMLREVSPSSGNHDVNVGACLDRHDKVRDVRCWQWGIEPKDEARPTVSDVANVIRDFGVDFDHRASRSLPSLWQEEP
jgi:hypothetical protein